MSSKFGTKIKVERTPKSVAFPKRHTTMMPLMTFVGTGVEVFPHQRFCVPLGFKIQLPSNMKLLIQPRSGMSGKGMVIHVWFPSWMGGGYLGKVRENLDVILGLIDCGYGEEVHAIVKSGRWKWKNRILRALGFRFFIHQGEAYLPRCLHIRSVSRTGGWSRDRKSVV